jgi:hypothetical protein
MKYRAARQPRSNATHASHLPAAGDKRGMDYTLDYCRFGGAAVRTALPGDAVILCQQCEDDVSAAFGPRVLAGAPGR